MCNIPESHIDITSAKSGKVFTRKPFKIPKGHHSLKVADIPIADRCSLVNSQKKKSFGLGMNFPFSKAFSLKVLQKQA